MVLQIVLEAPGVVLMLGFLLLTAVSGGAGQWVMENQAVVGCLLYALDLVVCTARCRRCRRNGISLWIGVPFTAVSALVSTSHLLLVIREAAQTATEGFLGLLSVILTGLLGLLTGVICKAPGALVGLLAREREAKTGYVVLEAVITLGFCLLFRWMYGCI